MNRSSPFWPPTTHYGIHHTMPNGPVEQSLPDPAVLVDIDPVQFLDLFDQGAQGVLRQLEMVFEGLDSILDGIGLSHLAVHQAGLHNFPENAHIDLQTIIYPRTCHWPARADDRLRAILGGRSGRDKDPGKKG
jgi:hypothetical protein